MVGEGNQAKPGNQLVHYKVLKKYQRETVREGWREGGNPSEAG